MYRDSITAAVQDHITLADRRARETVSGHRARDADARAAGDRRRRLSQAAGLARELRDALAGAGGRAGDAELEALHSIVRGVDYRLHVLIGEGVMSPNDLTVGAIVDAAGSRGLTIERGRDGVCPRSARCGVLDAVVMALTGVVGTHDDLIAGICRIVCDWRADGDPRLSALNAIILGFENPHPRGGLPRDDYDRFYDLGVKLGAAVGSPVTP